MMVLTQNLARKLKIRTHQAIQLDNIELDSVIRYFLFRGFLLWHVILLFFVLMMVFPHLVYAQHNVTQEDVSSIKAKQKEADENRKRLEKERKQTLRQLKELQKKLALNASDVQKLEYEMTLAESEISQLQKEKQRAEYQLKRDQDSLGNLLAALQRIEQRKPPALMIHPDDVIEAARAAGLIAEITPLIENRAENLKTKLKTYARLRQSLIQKQENLIKAEEKLSLKHQSIKK